MKLVQKAGIKDGLYEIDASTAQRILDARAKNRPLREITARRLARAIELGEWATNGETLIFDGQGRLIDGQHRMRATVIADRPIVTYCVFASWNRKAFDTIDIGHARKVSDMIALDGHMHYRLVASVARALMAWEHLIEVDGQSFTNSTRGGVFTPTATAVKRFYEKNVTEIDSVAEYVSPLKAVLKGFIPQSTVAFFLLMARRQSKEKAETFVDALCSGENLTKTSPVWHVRNQFLHLGRKGLMPEVQLALLIKAWKAYLSGRVVGTLKYSINESYPRFEDGEA